MRGFTPGPNGDMSRRNSRKEPRRNNENRDVNKAMSPTPIDENRPVQNGHGSPEEKPVRKEKKKIPDPMEIKEESPIETEQNIPSQKANGTLVDIEAPKGEKPQQSYLALTGLGGPDKKAEAKPNQGTPMAGNGDPANPNNGFYSFLKR